MELLEREDHLATLDSGWRKCGPAGAGGWSCSAARRASARRRSSRAFGERHGRSRCSSGRCDALFTPRPLGPLLDIAAEVGGELAELPSAAPRRERGARGVAARARGGRRRSSSSRTCTGPTRRRSTCCAPRPPRRADAGARARDLPRRRARRATTRCASCWASCAPRPHAADGSRRCRRRPWRALAARTASTPAALHARTGGNPFFVTEVLARAAASTPATRPRRRAGPRRAAAPRRRGGCSRRWPSSGRASRSGCWSAIAADDARGARGVPGLRDAARGAATRSRSATRSRARRSRTTLPPAPARRPAPGGAGRAARGRGDPARLAHHAEAAGDGAAVLELRARRRRSARRGWRPPRGGRPVRAPPCGTPAASPPAERAALLERRANACFLSGMIEEAVEAETLALEIYVGDRGRAAGGRRTPLARAVRLVSG